MTNKKGITKQEAREPLFKTWGRIRTRVNEYTNDKRLKELIEKLNNDLKCARVEENQFAYVDGLAEVSDGFYNLGGKAVIL